MIFLPSKYAAQLLERRITCGAHAAQKVIESHVVEQICCGSTLDGKRRSPRFLLHLEKVTQDMDYVRRKAIKIQQAQRDEVEPKHPTYSSPQPLTLEKKTNIMVGFDGLLLQLLDMLTGHPSSRRVIPIVGTGGVGKTTLAINAFDHKLIVQHFDICLWATISHQYVVQDILLTLLSSQEKSSSETVGELREKLHKKLYGRRYLIVLDDIWSVTAWDEMKYWFPDTSNRSRIIVTTRQSHLADHIGSSSRLALTTLDDCKSWDLFCQKAFAGQGCPLELKDVGKNIVRKCKGLPLAIVVIAGHLRKSSRTQECWENVAYNMKLILNSAESNQLLNKLSFSYSHLPVHLKPCFVYLGTYPEDELIYVRSLIKRWIAEGFLKPCKDDNLEDIANDYVKDLIDRNLIIDCVGKTKKGGSYCKIHDLLRELCLKVAEKEIFFNVVDIPRATCRDRRAGIQEKEQEENHNLEIFHARNTGAQLFDMRLCRVLNICEEILADDIDGGFLEVNADLQQVNLRYLEYYRNYRSYVSGSIYLPSSISLFWNLQTLIIGGVFLSVIAPNEIWEMIQLRHVEVEGVIHLPDPLSSHKLDQANELVIVGL